MADTLAVLNGPNLNMLGTREPDIYGSASLAEIEQRCRARAEGNGFGLVFEQTNSEGALVEAIQGMPNRATDRQIRRQARVAVLSTSRPRKVTARRSVKCSARSPG